MSTTVEVAVTNAVITRLAADATLTAIVPANRIDQLRGPVRMVVDDQLYMVVTPKTASDPKHAQRSDGFELTFFVLVVDRLANGLTNHGPIGERVYGDANKTIANNGVPAYGLHMHKLVLGADANGWLANTIMSYGSVYDGFDDIMVRTEEFRVQVSRVPA